MGWANNQICPQAKQFALTRIVMYNVNCVNRLWRLYRNSGATVPPVPQQCRLCRNSAACAATVPPVPQ
jgi:hypothetical protein